MSTKALTQNQAVTYKSAGSALVNLFFQIGASRNNVDAAKRLFDEAMASDLTKATAILLYARNCRGGMGERNVFRVLVKELIESDIDMARKVLKLVPQVGRFDDVKEFYGTPLQEEAVQITVKALADGNALAYKWNSREDKVLQKALNMNEASLRKYLAKGRKGTLVESLMCDNKWSDIKYDKIPSLAGIRLSKAFKRNDQARYTDFITSRETHVNNSVGLPHNVYQLFKTGEAEAASKYWDNLPKLTVDGKNIICIADVSGSMCCSIGGKVQAIDVSVSLGAYLAQQCTGHFHNKLITFSDQPTIVTLPDSKNLAEVFGFVQGMSWGMNTNLEKAFDAILNSAVTAKALPSDMPAMLLILSDMEFDQADRANAGKTLYETMQVKYAKHNYTAPKICWWNLNGSGSNFPVMKSERGACLVSGFSPNVLKAVTAQEEFTPESVVEEAIKPYLEMLAK